MRYWVTSIVIALILTCFPSPGLADPKVRSFALPLSFEQNLGQVSPETAFLSHGEVGVQLRPTGFDVSAAAGRVSFDFVGAGKATLSGEGRLPWVSNYLLSKDRSQWKTNIPNFRAVRYGSLYPGIDLVMYSSAGVLEHDFVVAPGADYRVVRLRVKGADTLALSQEGALLLKGWSGRLALQRPAIYQEFQGERRAVKGGFVLLAADCVGFWVDEYDHSRPLVIDPVVRYITYLGGTSASIMALDVDFSGNVYVGGWSCDTTFAITNSPTIPPNTSCTVSFAAKLDPAGTPVYITYVALHDIAGIGADRLGNLIVFGGQVNDTATLLSLSPSGTSLNYSVNLDYVYHARALSVRPGGDCFVAVEVDPRHMFLSTPGALRIGVGSYFGGAAVVHFDAQGQVIYSANIAGLNITVGGLLTDSDGNAYLVGASEVGLPTTQGAYQMSPTSPYWQTAFVAKINPAGSSFTYLTYIGGNSGITSAGLDATGSIYLLFHQSTVNGPSSGFFTTPGAYVAAVSTPEDYVVKLSPDGAKLLFSSLVGGEGTYVTYWSYLRVSYLSIDATGDIYLSGFATGDLVPEKDFVQLPSPDPSKFNAFVAALSSDGSSLWFGSSLFGSSNETVPSVVTGSDGYLYVYGTAYSQNLPTTPGAYQPWVLELFDLQTLFRSGFVAVFDPHADGPSICASPEVLTFGIAMYYTSASQSSELKNCGKAPFNPIFEMAGYFSQTNDCPATLVPGASCTLNITFAPRDPSVYGHNGNQLPGSLNIRDAVTKVSQRVFLVGNFIGGWAAVAPKAIPFSAQAIGTTSPATDIVLSNGGGDPIYPALSITGDFSQTSDCGSSIDVSGSCHIHVTFTPTAGGMRSGQLTVYYPFNQVVMAAVQLSGRGIPERLSTSSVDLGLALTGVMSRAAPLVINNMSPDPLALTGMSATAPFQFWSTCGGTVPPNASCTLMVSVMSATAQTLKGTLTFTVSGDAYSIPLQAVVGDMALTLSRPSRNPRPSSNDTLGNHFSIDVAIAKSVAREPSFTCTTEAAFVCNVRADLFKPDRTSRLVVWLVPVEQTGSRPKKRLVPVKLLSEGEVTMEVEVDVSRDESSDELEAAPRSR
jgi:hypothetical protein